MYFKEVQKLLVSLNIKCSMFKYERLFFHIYNTSLMIILQIDSFERAVSCIYWVFKQTIMFLLIY